MSRDLFWSIAMIAVTAIWGWSFAAKHDLLLEMNASALNAYMFLLAAVAVLPFSIQSFYRMRKADWMSGIGIGCVLFMAFALQTAGVAITTPSNAGFITGLCTVFTPIILYVIGKGRVRKHQSAGIAIAVVGLAMLSLDGFSVNFGDVLILGCAVAFAMHIVAVSLFVRMPVAIASTFLQLLTVGILSAAWSLYEGSLAMPEGRSSIVSILIVAILATGLGYVIQVRAQMRLPAEKVALILICEPVFAGVFGYWLADVRLSLINIIGALLILLGIFVSEFGWRRSSLPATFNCNKPVL